MYILPGGDDDAMGVKRAYICTYKRTSSVRERRDPPPTPLFLIFLPHNHSHLFRRHCRFCHRR